MRYTVTNAYAGCEGNSDTAASAYTSAATVAPLARANILAIIDS